MLPSYLSILLRQEGASGMEKTFMQGAALEPAALAEPGAVLQRFLNARDCYVMQSRPEGRYFSYLSTREGNYYMLTLLLRDSSALSGAKILEIFSGLRKVINERGTLDETSVDREIAACNLPQHAQVLRSWEYKNIRPIHDAAYRTYVSVADLEGILSFPAQREYEEFRCIIIVSVTSNLRSGVKIPRITAPVKKQFTISCPEDATCSTDMAYEGDTITVTYHLNGFDDHAERVTVGKAGPYSTLEGSTMIIKPARDCGITFSRLVPIEVLSQKGTPLLSYNIEVNGHVATEKDGYIELTRHDLTAADEVTIEVSSVNYASETKHIDPHNLGEEPLVFRLKPIEQSITLRLDFGDGRVMDVSTQIERHSTEYNRLHSGRFHGYRAHQRAERGDDGSELYYVDLKHVPESQPAFESRNEGAERRPSHEHSAPVSPVFENVADRADRPATRTYQRPVKPDEESAQEPVRYTLDDDDDDVEARPKGIHGTDYLKNNPLLKNKKLIWGALIVIAIIVIVFLIPRGNSLDVTPAAQTLTQGEQVGTTQTATPQSPTMDAGDLAYLNSSKVWVRSEITSADGRKLLSQMEQGNIDSLASHPYFAGQNTCTNSMANNVMDMLWAAKGTPNEKANIKKLKAAAKKERINLEELYKDLAKSKPVDAEANKTPRH